MKIAVGVWAIGLAEAMARASEDPYCQVGAVVLGAHGRLLLGAGYNGPPSGVELDWTDRDARRAHIIHAEQNALRLTTPVAARGGSLAVTHWPCAPCLNAAAAYGITRVYWRYPPDWERYPAEPSLAVARIARIKLIEVGEVEDGR